MSSANLQIQKWLEDIIIGLNLCPFAKKPYEEGKIRIESTETSNEEEMMNFFLDELEIINNDSNISTSIITYSKTALNFLDFNNFVGACEEILEELNLTDVYQLVCFHPEFYFDGLDKNERANYVNRSPIPLIHLLRFHEIELVLSSPQDGERISLANEKTLNELDENEFNSFFNYLN